MIERNLHDLVTTFTRSLRQRPEPIPLSLAADLMQFISELHTLVNSPPDANECLEALPVVVGASPTTFDIRQAPPPAPDPRPAPSSPYPGLFVAVDAAIASFEGGDFTTKEIQSYIHRRWNVEDKSISNISTRVAHKWTGGELERVSRGKGRTCAIYRRKTEAAA